MILILRTTIFFYSFFISVSAFCQSEVPFLWTQNFKSSGDGAQVLDIATDSQNRYLIVGTFNNFLTVENYTFTSRGSTDFFITQTDSLGKIIWIKQWGAEQEDGNIFVEVDRQDNVYVSGFFFFSTLVEQQLIQLNGGGTFISKLNSSGQLLWSRALGPYCQLMEVKVNQNGDFGIAGLFIGPVDFGGVVKDNSNQLQNTVFFASYTNNGQLNWVVVPESTSRYWSDLTNTVSLIDFDDIGNAYGVILFENDLTVGSIRYGGKKLALNLLFLKIDKAGNSSVGKVGTMIDYSPPPDPSMSPGGFPFVGGGQADAGGNLSLVGWYFGKLQFEDLTIVQSNPASYPNNMISDLFILRFNESFDLEWGFGLNMNGSIGKLKVLSDEQLVVSGYTPSDFNIGGCPIPQGLFYLKSTNGGQIFQGERMGKSWEGTYNMSTIDRSDNILIGGLIGKFTDYNASNNLETAESSGFVGKYKMREPAVNQNAKPNILSSSNVCATNEEVKIEATRVSNATSYQWEVTSQNQINDFYTATPALRLRIDNIPDLNDFQIRVKAYVPCGQTAFSSKVSFRVELPGQESFKEIYNVITPNGDNKNNEFILPSSLTNAELAIFNKWGQQLYYNKSYDNDWSGENLSAGVYFISVKLPCNQFYKGPLTIIR